MRFSTKRKLRSATGLWSPRRRGARFVNETGNRKVRSDAIIVTGHPAVLLVSEKNTKLVPPFTIEAEFKNGVIQRFAHCDETDAFYKIAPVALNKALSRWNEVIAKRNDTDFGAKFFDDTDVNDGAFFGCRLWPRVALAESP